ncbi:MAG: hypothetical protein BWY78_01331 [Alphaproteobacteria bacterium ADurb.Bin438]|nr:MAG: hypothetical protein BWY78_01331 [Alphaproteobacteria bacterium ADurb.Bin438]
MFGHARTFKDAFSSLKEKVIDVNVKKGYEVDVFLHIWSVNDYTNNIDLNDEDIKFIEENYKPKKYKIEVQTEGKRMHYSINSVNEIRLEYQKENNIQYDWVIFTRPDILFLANLIPDDFEADYMKKDVIEKGLKSDNIAFYGNTLFLRMGISDPRYITEADLVWFARPKNVLITPYGDTKGIIPVPIKFIHETHFLILRFAKKVSKRLFETKLKLAIFKFLPYCLVKNKIEKYEKKLSLYEKQV